MDLLKEYLDIAIFGILGVMSFVMIAFVIERIVFFAHVKVDEYTDLHTLQVVLTRHLTTIASIASNAPYIGLLGTVFGILITFHDLSEAKAGLSAEAIMHGLALALKATAAGLVVAVPATLSYNALTRKADVLMAQWSSKRI